MNLTKILLIDGAFLSIGILSFVILTENKSIFGFFKKSGNNQKLDQLSKIEPSLNELLKLECVAKKIGSGIQSDEIVGFWNFATVWNQEQDTEPSIFSPLLRLFSASLEISQCKVTEEALNLEINNSIQFGALLIKFIGLGELQGQRPLLIFYFDRIELKVGERILVKRLLKIPEKKERPFFALIGIDKDKRWLAARGRGGGLALWKKISA